MKLVQANVRIPEDYLEQLKAISERTGKSLNLLVREALKGLLGGGLANAPEDDPIYHLSELADRYAGPGSR